MRALSDEQNKSGFYPLSEEEKNILVSKHKNIVQYMANRYRFFDTEIEELIGWGYVGMAQAINQYDEDRSINLTDRIFLRIKGEIYRQYSKRTKPKTEVSIYEEVFSGIEGDELTIAETLADENQLIFNGFDMRKMIEEALFEESDLFKKNNIDWFIGSKSIKEIAKESGLSETLVKRSHRRGQTLIKLHLVNNGVIFDYVSHPSEEKIKEKKIINHKDLNPEEYGKIKYITKSYPFLSINDIALLLNTSSYLISQLLDYPTTTYIKARMDNSIKEKVLRYCKKKYPERLPGPVVINKDANKIMA